MSIFLEIKNLNESTVKYAVERLAVVLVDCNRTDLAGRITLLYEEITKALHKAEGAQINHEFRLHMLSAVKQAKGMVNLIHFIKIYKVIVVLDEDYNAFTDLVKQIEKVRRNTQVKETQFKAFE